MDGKTFKIQYFDFQLNRPLSMPKVPKKKINFQGINSDYFLRPGIKSKYFKNLTFSKKLNSNYKSDVAISSLSPVYYSQISTPSNNISSKLIKCSLSTRNNAKKNLGQKKVIKRISENETKETAELKKLLNLKKYELKH